MPNNQIGLNVTTEIQERNFIQYLINPLLDEIQFESVAAAPNILDQIKTEFAALTTEQPVTILKELQELYCDAEIYARKEHKQEDIDTIRRLLLERLTAFITEKSAYSAIEFGEYIQGRNKDVAEMQAAIQKSSAMLQPAYLKQSQSLPAATLQKMKQFNINLSTKQPEAEICIDICELLKKIDAVKIRFNVNTYFKTYKAVPLSEIEISGIGNNLQQIKTAIVDIFEKYLGYPAELIESLRSETSMPFAELDDTQILLKNLLRMFEQSHIPLNTYNTFNLEIRAYLSREPFEALKIVQTTNEEEFNLCVTGLRIRNRIDWLKEQTDMDATEKTTELAALNQEIIELLNHNFNLELSADTDANIGSQYLDNMLNLFKHSRFSIATFKTFELSSKLKMMRDPSIALELVEHYGLDTEAFTKHPHDFFANLMNLNSILKKLVDSTGLSLNDILKLPEAQVYKLFDRADDLIKLCQSADMTLGELFACGEKDPAKIKQAHEKVLLLLADQKNPGKATNLVKYFFINKANFITLPADNLAALLDNPLLAIDLFNNKVQAYNSEQLMACLNSALNSDEEHSAKYNVNRLQTQGYLVNLSKFTSTPLSLIASIRDLGLSFEQCRAIYEVLVNINTAYARHYINCFKEIDNGNSLNFNYDLKAIGQFFSPAEAVQIQIILDAYMINLSNMTTHASSLTPEFITEKAKMISPNIFNLVQNLLQLITAGSIAETTLCDLLEDLNLQIRNLIVGISEGNFSIKQMYIIKNIFTQGLIDKLSCVSEMTPKTAKRYKNLIGFLSNFKALKDTYKNLPTHYMPKSYYSGENSIFEYIYRKDELKAANMLASGVNPMVCNSKGSSLLACAIEAKASNLESVIRNKIRNATDEMLALFIDVNQFTGDLNSRNPDGETLLTCAIKCEPFHFDMVQALIARKVDVSLANARGETPMQLALARKQVVVVNDLLAVMPTVEIALAYKDTLNRV